MTNQHSYFTAKEVERWECLVRSHLGRRMMKKAHNLMLDITAVDDGLKPAYLYDIGYPEPDILLAFVKDLKNESLVSNYLSILKIGEDCLIVNPVGMSKLNYEELCSSCLINVSLSLESGPEVYRNPSGALGIVNVCKIILGNISSEKSVIFQIDDSLCNVTSLFGILLNYPLIYWYEQTNENASSGNCLSMEKLTVVNVYMRYRCEMKKKDNSLIKNSEGEHCLYSFSYPSCLTSIVSSRVSDWFSHLKEVVKNCDKFLGLRLTTEEKPLEAVSL